MKIIRFGTLRSIELYSEDDLEKIKNFSNYVKVVKLDEKLNSSYSVIGSVNGMTPIIINWHQSKDLIMAIDSVTNEFVPIAASRNQLEAIITVIEEIWKPYSSAMFLPRNEKTRKQFKEIIIYLKKIAGIDTGYWLDFAFKELDIRYEV